VTVNIFERESVRNRQLGTVVHSSYSLVIGRPQNITETLAVGIELVRSILDDLKSYFIELDIHRAPDKVDGTQTFSRLTKFPLKLMQLIEDFPRSVRFQCYFLTFALKNN